MNGKDNPEGTVAAEQTEPESKATEQKQPEITGTSLSDTLLKEAFDMGHEVGEPLPEVEKTPPEGEDPSQLELPGDTKDEKKEPEKEPELGKTEETEEEEELKPAAKKDDEWPASAKKRIAEETEKRRQRTELLEKAEARVAELERQLVNAQAPSPTEDSPFIDIQSTAELERLERSYEKTIDLADDNPEGVEGYVVGRGKNGEEITRDFTPEELSLMKRKAEKAVRKLIPDRRKYLEQRVAADNEAIRKYPELENQESDFTKITQTLAYRVITGQAMKEPDVLIWVARAVRGLQLEQSGNGAAAKDSPEKRIIESSRQKIAPTPTKTRSFTERGSSSANLAKAEKQLEETGSADAAEAYVAALRSQAQKGAKKLEPLPD